METIPKCEHCGTLLQKHPHKNYWVCPKWLPKNQGCQGTIWYSEESRKKNYPEVAFSYKVPSKSHPGIMRQIKVYETGDTECGCWAGDRAKWCRHKEIMIEEVSALLAKIRKQYASHPENPQSD